MTGLSIINGWPGLEDYEGWPRVARHAPVPFFEMTRTLDADAYFEMAWGVLKGSIEGYARKLTRDYDEHNDLVQIAMITLWLGDPMRYNFKAGRDVRYVRTVVIHRMQDAWGMAMNGFRRHAETLVAELPRVSADDPRLHLSGGFEGELPC